MCQYKFQMAQVITQCRSSNPTSCSKVTFRCLVVRLCGLCRASLTWLVMGLYESPFSLIALDNMSSMVLLLISLISQQCFMNHLRPLSWLYGNHPWFVRFQSFRWWNIQFVAQDPLAFSSSGTAGTASGESGEAGDGESGSWLGDGEGGVWSNLGGFTRLHHETFETLAIQNSWRRWNWFTWPCMVHPKKRKRKSHRISSTSSIPAAPAFSPQSLRFETNDIGQGNHQGNYDAYEVKWFMLTLQFLSIFTLVTSHEWHCQFSCHLWKPQKFIWSTFICRCWPHHGPRRCLDSSVRFWLYASWGVA